jgi:hypothetical protein
MEEITYKKKYGQRLTQLKKSRKIWNRYTWSTIANVMKTSRPVLLSTPSLRLPTRRRTWKIIQNITECEPQLLQQPRASPHDVEGQGRLH